MLCSCFGLQLTDAYYIEYGKLGQVIPVIKLSIALSHSGIHLQVPVRKKSTDYRASYYYPLSEAIDRQALCRQCSLLIARWRIKRADIVWGRRARPLSPNWHTPAAVDF